MMKIVTLSKPQVGVSLQDLPFGTIVVKPVNMNQKPPVYYLVTCLMDGTGVRHLVTLPGGVLNGCDHDERVIPVNATMIVSDDVRVLQGVVYAL